MIKELKDVLFMKEAIKEAEKAYKANEVPVGAIIVCNNQIIARSHNQTEKLKDSTAHAEMIALTSAFAATSNKYLKDATIYVTLEPCIMCAGAMHWAQIKRLVFSADDPSKGYKTINNYILHPRTVVTSGILREQTTSLLKDFFLNLRCIKFK